MIQSGLYLKARSLKKEGKYDLAHTVYQESIKAGDAKGYYGLALIAEETGVAGEELIRMYSEPFVAIKQMALAGDFIAATIVGIYYAMGLGNVNQDQKQAHLWFLIGAMGGDEVAQFNLAVHFYLGVVVEKNIDTAVAWLQKSIQKSYPPAFELYNEIKNNIKRG